MMLTLEADRLDEEETERRKRTLFLVWFIALLAVLLVLLFWLFGLGGLSNIIAHEKNTVTHVAANDPSPNSGGKILERATRLIVIFVKPGDEPWFGTTPVASLPCIHYAGAECGARGNRNGGAGESQTASSHIGGGENDEGGGAGNPQIAFDFDGGWHGGGGFAYNPPSGGGIIPPTDDSTTPPQDGNPPPANVDTGDDSDGSIGQEPSTPTTPVDDTDLSNPGDADLPDIVAIDYPKFPPSSPPSFRRMPGDDDDGDGDDTDTGTLPDPNGPDESNPILGPDDVLIFDPVGPSESDAATDVPEPGSMLLLGSGLFALGAFRRRRRA